MEEVNISAILYDLLREHIRISVPCLGSFVAEYHSASASTDNKYLLPPFKQVSFSSQEIWNDERLERELANREGCSIAEAQEKVAFWVDELCFKLGIDRKVRLDKLGYLTLSQDNQVSFTLDTGINLLNEAYGLTPIEAVVPDLIPSNSNEKPKHKVQKKRKYDLIIFIAVLVAVSILLVVYYNV